ncbi:nucleotidyltransferase domain-containing protein [Actinomadura verrucosospora]|uniref:Response regulator n=1 Tax=Actinomadura verrucosospora TaxID=46165 RepID=A0A7D3VZQ4_ACTVE|nr:nucleotidyltransferase domain-containing protein [Actinomadura verrucosospora]QKG22811.1 response regulator [Actinomadura verrucosospora]
MEGVHYPTSLHRRVLGEVLAELRGDPAVSGVLLGGSLARGTARTDSDLDVLVVAEADAGEFRWRRRERALPVDFIVRSAPAWRTHFAPDRIGDESWGYMFLDGVVLHDPGGIVARLRADAAEIHAGYHVPAKIKDHYAWLWGHVRPKMIAVLERGDPVEIGWAAAAMTNDLVRTVWAANDLPNPSLDIGTFQRHLDDLTVPEGVADRLRLILASPPERALRLQIELAALFAGPRDVGGGS